MKKYLPLILLLISAIMVTSCSNSEEPAKPQEQEQANPPAKEEAEEEKEVEVGVYPGMKAPDLILKDRDDNEIKISDYAGKVIFLNFWATTCPYCVDEMPDLEAFYQAHKDDSDVVLIGVNMTKTWEKQGKKQLIEWLDQEEITFPSVFDEDGVEADRWMATSLPVTYIIDQNGISQGAIMGRTTVDVLEEVLEEVRASDL